MSKQKSIYKTTITIGFLLALILPNIILFSGAEKNLTNNENRAQANVPKFNTKQPIQSIGKFKNYYLQNFGLKTVLVNNYIKLKTNYLNENPIPNRTLKGKDGWHFLGNENNNVLNNSFGNDVFKTQELNNTVNYLVTINNYFKSQNIAFYFVIAPDKNNIYQEFLPYKLKQNATKLDVLKKEIKKKSNLTVIDLTQPLLNNKSLKQLYFKTDTHWNFDGAFIGYNYTIDVINKDYNIEKTKIQDYKIEQENYTEGDLIKMINQVKAETYNKYTKIKKTQVKEIYSEKNKMRFKNETKQYKMLQFRDSFANYWYSFFNESFAETLYLKKYTFTKAEIESFKPDIVILEIVERNINLLSELKPFKN